MNGRTRPTEAMLEAVPCYLCGSERRRPLLQAQDDLTGKPGDFQFVQCEECELAYQSPRVRGEHIGSYYDDEYIAHRKKTDWGPLTGFYNWGMGKHDRDKVALVRRFVDLTAHSRVLDVGCGAGTFLLMVKDRCGAQVTGVDFKDLRHLPGFDRLDFRCGVLRDQDLPPGSFDLVTMWHFLEHDYQPRQTLERARELLAPGGKLVIEVPRLDSVSARLFGKRWPGLQAPQHTVLYDKKHLLELLRQTGLEVQEYLPYGAFPAYFYLFTGTAFTLLQGKGLDLSRAIYPYFLGQLLLSPALLFERHLNLAMQAVVCRKAP